MLAIDIASSLVAREALAARHQLNKLLIPYYEAKHDQRPDVSDIIRERANVLRREGFNDVDLGIQEITIPWVGTTNSIPTLFWLFLQVFSRPEYVDRIRAEAEAMTSYSDGPTGRVAVLQASKLEKHCPVLNACYQETLRVYLHPVGNRRVMTDTTITGQEGREYLLKKGVNVQWPPMVTHFLQSVWGDDAEIFDPERFLRATPQAEKLRRGALLPFGGGRHLCPGRKFALTEILGFVSVVALGFEVEGVSVPASTNPAFGSSPRQPVWGTANPGFTLSRRVGWEDVTWKFVP